MKKGLSVEEYAAKQAEFWKNGLATGARMAHASNDCAMPAISPSTRPAATPGLPVSILKSFSAPPPEIIR